MSNLLIGDWVRIKIDGRDAIKPCFHSWPHHAFSGAAGRLCGDLREDSNIHVGPSGCEVCKAPIPTPQDMAHFFYVNVEGDHIFFSETELVDLETDSLANLLFSQEHFSLPSKEAEKYVPV